MKKITIDFILPSHIPDQELLMWVRDAVVGEEIDGYDNLTLLVTCDEIDIDTEDENQDDVCGDDCSDNEEEDID